jgi:hypothetical protein
LRKIFLKIFVEGDGNPTGEGQIGRSSIITKRYEGLLIDSHRLLLRVNKEFIDPNSLCFFSIVGFDKLKLRV